ncbi:MAG: hypothetical protein WAK21_08965 [Candidatus Sulfotelmatobacter sp.]|jgi:hypothetical protein
MPLSTLTSSEGGESTPEQFRKDRQGIRYFEIGDREGNEIDVVEA